MPRVSSMTTILIAGLTLATLASCGGNKAANRKSSDTAAGDTATATDGSTEADTSSGDSDTSGPQAITAWTMVTEDDLKKITGTEYTRLESQGDYAYLKHCAYQDSAGGNVSVTFVPVNAQQRYDTFLKYPNRKDVAGIGTQATWCSDVDTICILSDRGAVEVQFRQKGIDEAGKLETAKSIARLVLERI